MPAPIRPSEICALVPSGTSSLCDRILKVFIQLPAKICAWATWMFNEDGTLTDAFKDEAQIIPTGTVIARMNTAVPTGWLACTGQEVSRETYPLLFATIGTVFGAGNGSTTFNVPNIQGRFLYGKSSTNSIGDTGGEAEHVLTAAEMRHFHGVGDGDVGTVDGQWCLRDWSAGVAVGTGTHSIDTTAPAASVPAISSGRLGTSDSLAAASAADPHNCLPPYVVCQYLIKT
jgi:microcystin-dependent protein